MPVCDQQQYFEREEPLSCCVQTSKSLSRQLLNHFLTKALLQDSGTLVKKNKYVKGAEFLSAAE